jgi:tungstate transport system ATP-binding protein
MATHNLAQAKRLAEEVVFLDGGRVTEHTAADEFFRSPRSLQARTFLEGERL